MVARRDREHTRGAFARIELRELVECAALLERRGELQVLELQEHLAADQRRQRARRQARRVDHLAAQALAAARTSASVRSAALDIAGPSRPGRP
jgi:hypothetical protein